MQGDRGTLCDFLVFLKDMELQTVLIRATSAGLERSFSSLKWVKSYTCNTMGQCRLSRLALLAIERTLVKSLDKTASWYDRVTYNFLEKDQSRIYV